jgi:hypothetical protein
VTDDCGEWVAVAIGTAVGFVVGLVAVVVFSVRARSQS